MSKITDAFGVEAKIGDTVAFGVANAGAKPLKVGEVIAVNPKTVTVQFVQSGQDWQGNAFERVTTQTRAIGAFVIKP